MNGLLGMAIAGLLAALGLAGAGAAYHAGYTRPAQAPVHSDSSGQYYIVVTRGAQSGGASQSSVVVVQNGSTAPAVTVQGNRTVDCGSFPTQAAAEAAARERHPAGTWTVVSAADAYHALLQGNPTMGVDLGRLMPSVSDSAICTA